MSTQSRSERLTARLVQTSEKLAQVKAGELLQVQRIKFEGRKKLRMAQLRRWLQLGKAVERAGLSGWSMPELMGALLDARDRIGRSPTMKLAACKRGEQHLGRKQEREKLDAIAGAVSVPAESAQTSGSPAGSEPTAPP